MNNRIPCKQRVTFQLKHVIHKIMIHQHLMHKHMIQKRYRSFPGRNTIVAFLFSICVVLMLGCSSSACLNDVDLRGFSVTLEKGACFGQCPTYKAVISGDLSVAFQATAFVEPPRAPKGTIAAEDMCDLLHELEESGFTSTKGEVAPVADAPLTKITVKRGALMHTVEWNISVPKNLNKLHDLLVAQTYRNPTLLNHTTN